MKKEEGKNSFNIEKPALEYISQQSMNIPSYVDEEIRIGLEQAQRGELIPVEEVFARYR